MGEGLGGEGLGCGGSVGACGWRDGFRVREGVDTVFEADPGDQGGAEGEIEESFVRDGEDDEGGGECEEDDNQAVEVMIVWTELVDKRKAERGY